MTSYQYVFKYIVIGDTGAGKSCLLLQYTDQRFEPQYDVTIGVEFGTKYVNVNKDTCVKLQVWDTAGQETFKSITRSYYKNTVGCILVYDVTRKDTFKNITEWLEDTKKYCSAKKLHYLLIGNKTDLEHLRQVNTSEGQNFAKKNGLLFFETSAKTGQNVQTAFNQLTNNIYNDVNSGLIDVSDPNSGVQTGVLDVLYASEDKNEDNNKGPCGNCTIL